MTDTTMRTIIPALGGWSVALFCPAGSTWSDRFDFVPIVAWEIVREEETHQQPGGRKERWVVREAIPITPAGDLNSHIGGWVLRSPEGFYLPAELQLITEADAMAQLQQAWRAERTTLAKAATTA